MKCVSCGNDFVANRSYQRCCSRRCGRLNRYAKNPQKYRDKCKRLRLANPELYRERSRAHDVRRKDKRSAELYVERRTYPWLTLFRSAKTRAKALGIPFSITKEMLRELWTGQCELTGVEFKIGNGRGGSTIYSPNLDKIIPSLGYVPGNVRFILKAVNFFKQDGTDEQMYEIAEALLKKRNSPSPAVTINTSARLARLLIGSHS